MADQTLPVEIVSIKSTKARPTEYKVHSSGEQTFFSSSLLIQASLFPALLYDTVVQVVVESDSKQVQRVIPYHHGTLPKPLKGTHEISQIATQRGRGSDEHLEVFLVGHPASYNVYDSRVQQLLIEVFSHQDEENRHRIDATLDDAKHEITSVTLRH
jgi:hypothetical protein